MMSNYTIYHLHSDLSSCVTSIDSVTKFDEYIQRAKECGMKALAFSEHGSFFSWVKKKEHIEAAGMKYIHAAEFYVTKTTEEKIRDNRHVVLIAANYDGVLELNRLSSISFNREDGHYFYVPRITIDELCAISDNIICTTACLAGILNNDEMKDQFISFLKNNKHRCFLEIQHHEKSEEQKRYNKYLYDLSKEIGVPLIAGTDTHALNDEHMQARAILQKAKNITFPEEDNWDLTFKTYDELVATYERQNSLPMKVVLEAIENTNKMADMVESFELDRSYKYPHLWEDSEKVLIKKIKEGIKRRGIDKYPNRNEYAKRVKYELEAYKHNQAIDFMLLMEDLVSWCRTQDIQIGYGRGSVNGSIIAWLLGITEMDSIKHNLNFDRFMNIERVSLSDVDTDFPPSRIEDVKQYLFTKHGLYCCDIATFNTIADKGAIRDVGRALNIPLSEVAKICDAVDNEKEYAQVREANPELFKYVDRVKGVVVSVGNHPCGTVVAPYSIDDRMGIFTSSTDAYPISQIYMKEIDGLNYVKLDLLKLDTIELIANTCKLANIDMLTPDNMDINDVAVWNSMRDDTTQIFQWEGKTGDSYIKRLLSDENIKRFKEVDENVDRMTLLSIGNSAIRPAGASYRDDLANGVVRKSGSDAIDDFLKPTFGYLVFQCQIIEFLHSYCGFTMGEADVVRRHFAKKTGTDKDIPIIKDGGYMTEEKKHHISGFVETMHDKYNMTKEESEKTIDAFLKVIIDASNYLFSVNHSTPYSYEGYASAWLRYYHPTEFLTCAFNINKDNEEKTIGITNYAKKVGVQIKPIKFGFSRAEYSCNADKKEIYKGIESIKFMNATIAEELYKLSQHLAYKNDFLWLLREIKTKTSVNSKQLDILIKLDFFSDFGHPNQLLQIVKIFDQVYGKKQFKKDKIAEMGYLIDEFAEFSQKETDKTLYFDDTKELMRYLIKEYPGPKTSKYDRLNYEVEFLGYIQTVLPKMSKDYYYVTAMKGKDSRMVTIYQLKTGKSLTYKVRKKLFDTNPFEVGQILHITEFTNDFKWRKTVDEKGKTHWEQSSEREMLITKYAVLTKDKE